MAIRTINGITIMGNDGENCSYHNSRNGAHFSRNNKGVSYTDSVGNYMSSTPRFISINFQSFELEKYGDEIRKSDGTRMIIMPKEQIQEIANSTFYNEGQFHVVDFLTFSITEENKEL
ncbi:hypothetical protein ACFFLS_11330 [Flavobacterium procerum]|uniref:Uncharacterized protein n=1 Tax=Flavobacterium procerum TaxID=1455569 RepID=A0ABV6BQ96_9FLAO